MIKRVVIITLILLVAILVPIFWAASSAGFNVTAVLSRMPVTKMFFAPPAEEPPDIIPISPLEKENQELRSTIAQLEGKIAALEGEKTKIMQEQAELQQELADLRAYKSQREDLIINSRQLASFYKEMKPEAVARIMENMDDNTVLLVLPLLDKEQSGKILSLLDPQRAALLTQILLGTANPPSWEEQLE